MKSLFLFLIFCSPQFFQSGISTVSPYTINDKEKVRIDDHMQGIWKFAEDTDSHNYFIVEKDGDYGYCITYMNRSGNNRGLEHNGLYFGEVNNVKFLTLYNWDQGHHGYVLLKIKSVGRGSWDVVASLVTDPSITKVKSSAALRALLAKNLDNPSFYGKDLHFRKKFEFNSCH